MLWVSLAMLQGCRHRRSLPLGRLCHQTHLLAVASDSSAQASPPQINLSGESSSSPALPSSQQTGEVDSDQSPGSFNSTGSYTPIAARTRHQIAPTVQGTPLVMAPLRQLPGAGDVLVTVHAPWTPGDLKNLAKGFPKFREEPGKFKEELEIVFQCYDPSWADVN